MSMNDAFADELPRSRDEALNAMRILLLRSKIEVSTKTPDKLFSDHWLKLSTLAHQIHGRI